MAQEKVVCVCLARAARLGARLPRDDYYCAKLLLLVNTRDDHDYWAKLACSVASGF